ncbi:MAG: gamma carbonic anhydrase family protein [Chitinophagales bacterium]|nr:gamma carbonic anhydrase family protein [Chitinophagales bacterium]
MHYPYLDKLQQQVKKGKNVFIAPGAWVLGDITLGDEVSIWFNASLRADFDSIVIGDKTNVQEGVIMHVDHGAPIKIGVGNTIGHGAVIHGCTIGDYNLIGIKAVLLNNVQIGKGCVIGANALLTENMVVPDYSLVVGAPGKVIRTLPEDIIAQLQFSAEVYKEEAANYLRSITG